MLALALGLTLGAVPLAALRRSVAEIALAQVTRVDPDWEPKQRDCAGLVRFAFGRAYRRLAPDRLAEGLWRDGRGGPSAFADAGTLLERSFSLLGRDAEAQGRVESGDLAAFLLERDAGPVFHLMLVVRGEDRARAPLTVVYHTGDPAQGVRSGALRALLDEAPREWRPAPDNPRFLGFFRFKEWISHE